MRRFLSLLILAFLSAPPGLAYSEMHWGVEIGGSRSSLEQRTMSRPNQERSHRVLPAVGVLVVFPVADAWSLGPAIRYVQQGDKVSWHYEWINIAGQEEVMQHTLGGGIGIRVRLPHSLFLSADPEITYLLGGTLTGSRWDTSRPTVSYEDDLAANSDRWNATIRAGAGRAWKLAGGVATLNLRYVRGINDMTRIVPSHLTGSQRNIAWTAVGDPPYVSEWRTESVELMAGFLW